MSGGIGFADPSTLNCTVSTCLVDTSFYGYRISLAANITFLILFCLCLAIYAAIWIYTRVAHFFSAVMILGVITEILGYSARIWSYYYQWAEPPYLMQIICLTLAPAFFSAGIYLCLAKIAEIYGRDNSRFKPLWYTFIFIPCDAIALLLQAIGGGLATSALTTYDFDDFNRGRYILTAGLAWQVFTLFCFLLLCGDLAFRIRRRTHRLGTSIALSQDARSLAVRQSRLFRAFQIILALATVLIFWRCVYRLVELNDGFNGPITYEQGLFIGFEGVLVVVVAVLLAVLHPTICMGEMRKR